MLKDIIIDDYSEIVALHEVDAKKQRDYVCKPIFDPIKNDYPKFEGYLSDADLGFGCAFPFKFAELKKGDSVADLGCASGIDSFIMAEMVGKTGTIFGFDITPALIERANAIKNSHQINQVQFETADISEIPLNDNSVDVCTSNGVFSLITDLEAVFSEVKRILKPNGVFCLSDINKKVDFRVSDYENIKTFTGCLNGIRQQGIYLNLMKSVGFKDIQIVEERPVVLPTEISTQQGLFITTFIMRK